MLMGKLRIGVAEQGVLSALSRAFVQKESLDHARLRSDDLDKRAAEGMLLLRTAFWCVLTAVIGSRWSDARLLQRDAVL
jgi:hypothetical protein